MKLDQREWITEIATSGVAGIFTGMIAAWCASVGDLSLAALHGGVIGLGWGFVSLPLKWLLDRRPPANGE